MDYSAYESELGIGFIMFYVIYMLIMLGLAVAGYVLRASGLYSIAKRRSIRQPWMAWVPVADCYLLGCVSDQYQYVVKGKNKSKRKALLALNIIDVALALVMTVFYVVAVVSGIVNGDENALVGYLMGAMGLFLPLMGISIALMVLRYMALYDLYSSCNPDNSVLFLVLGIFFSVAEPFFIFFSRKKDDGMPPRKPEPVCIPQQPQYE